MGKGGWTIVRADLGLLDVGFGPFGGQNRPQNGEKHVETLAFRVRCGCGRCGGVGRGVWKRLAAFDCASMVIFRSALARSWKNALATKLHEVAPYLRDSH